MVALPCESAPIRERYGLRRVESKLFPVYSSDDGLHWLVESGIGRTNAAAATLHLHHLSGVIGAAIWVNVGVAGHADAPVGTLYRVNQAREVSSNRVHYPTRVYRCDIPSGALNTVDQVARHLEPDTLYDMEGATFLDLASRLSTQELVLCFKVVSDHGGDLTDFPKPDTVSEWIAGHLEAINASVVTLRGLAATLNQSLSPVDPTLALPPRLHFTATQRHQAGELLRRWTALQPEVCLSEVDGDSAAQWISAVKAHLDQIVIDWERP